jgi:hypothetical protein
MAKYVLSEPLNAVDPESECNRMSVEIIYYTTHIVFLPPRPHLD